MHIANTFNINIYMQNLANKIIYHIFNLMFYDNIFDQDIKLHNILYDVSMYV